jgi:hypothetical protein
MLLIVINVLKILCLYPQFLQSLFSYQFYKHPIAKYKYKFFNGSHQ